MKPRRHPRVSPSTAPFRPMSSSVRRLFADRDIPPRRRRHHPLRVHCSTAYSACAFPRQHGLSRLLHDDEHPRASAAPLRGRSQELHRSMSAVDLVRTILDRRVPAFPKQWSGRHFKAPARRPLDSTRSRLVSALEPLPRSNTSTLEPRFLQGNGGCGSFGYGRAGHGSGLPDTLLSGCRRTRRRALQSLIPSPFLVQQQPQPPVRTGQRVRVQQLEQRQDIPVDAFRIGMSSDTAGAIRSAPPAAPAQHQRLLQRWRHRRRFAPQPQCQRADRSNSRTPTWCRCGRCSSSSSR